MIIIKVRFFIEMETGAYFHAHNSDDKIFRAAGSTCIWQPSRESTFDIYFLFQENEYTPSQTLKSHKNSALNFTFVGEKKSRTNENIDLSGFLMCNQWPQQKKTKKNGISVGITVVD